MGPFVLCWVGNRYSCQRPRRDCPDEYSDIPVALDGQSLVQFGISATENRDPGIGNANAALGSDGPWQLCLFTEMKSPGVAGFDDHICDCDQLSRDSNSDELVRLATFFQTFGYLRLNWIVVGGCESRLEQHLPE
ncbi:hypothetical protein M3P21_20240 [Ruegeria sp. 2012CJ41-6]|uniref:Uncharacterized protein n=1 Tax=Ruegeria spongiae TaxID=2942209 RepID=A0ABT0Q7K2_9RHOB|nr:hypothetical protein [Ruegeria spongiae]MCL6285851.1 hypothetical protein [Ruegeria spongiae]